MDAFKFYAPRPTAEPIAVETRVRHERHFAGKALETVADHDANEQLRAEQLARALADETFAAQSKALLAGVDPTRASA